MKRNIILEVKNMNEQLIYGNTIEEWESEYEVDFSECEALPLEEILEYVNRGVPVFIYILAKMLLFQNIEEKLETLGAQGNEKASYMYNALKVKSRIEVAKNYLKYACEKGVPFAGVVLAEIEAYFYENTTYAKTLLDEIGKKTDYDKYASFAYSKLIVDIKGYTKSEIVANLTSLRKRFEAFEEYQQQENDYNMCILNVVDQQLSVEEMKQKVKDIKNIDYVKFFVLQLYQSGSDHIYIMNEVQQLIADGYETDVVKLVYIMEVFYLYINNGQKKQEECQQAASYLFRMLQGNDVSTGNIENSLRRILLYYHFLYQKYLSEYYYFAVEQTEEILEIKEEIQKISVNHIYEKSKDILEKNTYVFMGFHKNVLEHLYPLLYNFICNN